MITIGNLQGDNFAFTDYGYLSCQHVFLSLLPLSSYVHICEHKRGTKKSYMYYRSLQDGYEDKD